MGVHGETSFLNALVAENRFVAKGRMEMLYGLERIFCPRLGREGIMSPGGVLFWAKCIQTLDGFVSDKDDSLLELRMPAQ